MIYLTLPPLVLSLLALALGGAWLACKPWDEADGAAGEQNGCNDSQSDLYEI